MKKKIIEIISNSIEEFNENSSDKIPVKGPGTVLMGNESKLDSLGLVSLLITVEQYIEDELEKNITIADEKAMSQKHSPFRTIGTLADYIDMLLNEIQNSK